jgi:hypothetical protein
VPAIGDSDRALGDDDIAVVTLGSSAAVSLDVWLMRLSLDFLAADVVCSSDRPEMWDMSGLVISMTALPLTSPTSRSASTATA